MRTGYGLFHAELEHRARHGQLFFDEWLHDGIGLLFKNAFHLNGLALFQHFVAQREDFLLRTVAADAQCHVVEVIERVVAAVKVLRGDFRNALHRARNVVLDRVRVVHGTQQVEHHAPLRVIVIHFDLLADDAELFFNGLFCKIRGLHKVEQNLQRLLCVFRAGEQVARRLKGRIRVCGSADLGIAAECVAVFAFKKLVLQKMRDARGCRLCLILVAAFKDLIDGAVARAKHRIRTAHFRFRVYKHGQAACVFDAAIAVPKKFAFHKGILHFCAHFAAPFSL